MKKLLLPLFLPLALMAQPVPVMIDNTGALLDTSLFSGNSALLGATAVLREGGTLNTGTLTGTTTASWIQAEKVSIQTDGVGLGPFDLVPRAFVDRLAPVTAGDVASLLTVAMSNYTLGRLAFIPSDNDWWIFCPDVTTADNGDDVRRPNDRSALTAGRWIRAETRETAAAILAKLLTVDGTGSGLDADTLDGQSSAAFQANITATTSADYYRGDKTFQPLNKAAVGLGNVENTAISTWPGSANITTIGTISSGTVPVANVSGLGTAATLNVAASGDAAAGEVVKGDDSRLGAGASGPDIQVFTSNGTWTKPGGKSVAYVWVIAGGGGGGSGRRGAAGTIRCGGGGGGGGGYSFAIIPLAALGATESETVGTGGTSGAARTTDDINGTSGGSGNPSSFGSYVRATGGGSGAGGTASAGGGGSAGTGSFVPAGGGAANTSGGAGNNPAAALQAGAGGGAGAGITVGNAVSNGGPGGTVQASSGVAAGTGGTAGGNGGNGNNATSVGPVTGTGGGGGASSVSAASGSGGNGARGAGGGGGAASVNGFNSGAGGVGGDGIVYVLCL